MKRQYKYRIDLNGGSRKGKAFSYAFGRTKSIYLLVGKQKATVEFCLTIKKEFDDIVGLDVQLVPDALRKIQLLHAVTHGVGLCVKEMAVSIDDEKRAYGPGHPFFPFLFSMLSGKPVGISPEWSSSAVTSAIVNATKTQIRNAPPFAAMYAFLAAVGREYEIDKFAGLWTSMNAYYNYIFTCRESESASPLKKGDADCIGALLRILRCGAEKPSRSCQQTYRADYAKVGDSLQGLSPEEIDALCTQLECETTNRRINFAHARFEPINDLAAKLSITPYGLMLLEYPYHWRCRYFHGERVTLLFSGYNGRELSILRVLNRILTGFLTREIPKMFSGAFFTDEMRSAIEPHAHGNQDKSKRQKARLPRHNARYIPN